MVKIQFFGASREVGRSCIGISSNELEILLDAGVSPSAGQPLQPKDNFKTPDAIALSHAHLDHSGFMPAIYKHSNPPIITTFPTIPLVNILLEDMQKLLDEKGVPQYFNTTDFKRMNRSFVALPYEMEYKFFEGTTLKLYDAGHILGSSQLMVSSKGKKILYSGDFNLLDTKMHRGAKIPKEKINCLIMESTYGNREHSNRKKLVKDFVYKIKDAISRKQSVIIPSFAVVRTQEILSMLYEHDLIGNAVLDGMGIRASDIYMEYPSYIRNSKEFQSAYEEVDKAFDSVDRKKFIKPGKIFVCTAGMLEGGPVLSYMQRLSMAGISSNVFLTGYQAAGTNGRFLLEKHLIRMNGKTVHYNGGVETYDFSAHSGREQLLEYAKGVAPEKILLTHGDQDQMTPLYDTLKKEGFDVSMPLLDQKIEI